MKVVITLKDGNRPVMEFEKVSVLTPPNDKFVAIVSNVRMGDFGKRWGTKTLIATDTIASIQVFDEPL